MIASIHAFIHPIPLKSCYRLSLAAGRMVHLIAKYQTIVKPHLRITFCTSSIEFPLSPAQPFVFPHHPLSQGIVKLLEYRIKRRPVILAIIIDPPPWPASVLSPLWVFHLSFSLSIGPTGSHVPHKGLDQVHATFLQIKGVCQLPLKFSLTI